MPCDISSHCRRYYLLNFTLYNIIYVYRVTGRNILISPLLWSAVLAIPTSNTLGGLMCVFDAVRLGLSIGLIHPSCPHDTRAACLAFDSVFLASLP